jgi:hypothetical protein
VRIKEAKVKETDSESDEAVAFADKLRSQTCFSHPNRSYTQLSTDSEKEIFC